MNVKDSSPNSGCRESVEAHTGCIPHLEHGYICNHGSPSGERDTASPRGRYGGTPSA